MTLTLTLFLTLTLTLTLGSPDPNPTLTLATPVLIALAPASHPGQERDTEWTKFTPEQLAEKNKAKTLASDIFHRKPAHELFCEEAVLRPSEGTAIAADPNPGRKL